MPALARLAGKRVRSSECLLNNETARIWPTTAFSKWLIAITRRSSPGRSCSLPCSTTMATSGLQRFQPSGFTNTFITPVLHKFRWVYGLSSVLQGIENMQHIVFDGCIGAH